MISTGLADTILLCSLAVCVAAYVYVSRREGSYLNLLTPTFVIAVPAYYLLPLVFTVFTRTDATVYAYAYVYATLAVENVVFAYVYTRPARKLIRLPLAYSYDNFTSFAFFFIGLSVLAYAPVVLQFPEYILHPREIYTHTRTGFGIYFYLSSAFSYLSVILIQFSNRSRAVKGVVVLAAMAVLILHGSKGQVLSLVLLLALFEVYIKGRKVNLWASLLVGAGLGVLGVLLLAATMALGDSPAEALQSMSEYSDYTRNAMLVIDSRFPIQYGRLTMESQIIGRIPRAIMPNKPKNFGAMYLDDYFYPESLDQDAGSPDFGVGVQYADFGYLAIVYLALFAILRGWLARIFVTRLRLSRHPSDFFMLAFLANVSLIPVGGIGWLFPEALLITLFLRFASSLGAQKLFRESIRLKRPAYTD